MGGRMKEGVALKKPLDERSVSSEQLFRGRMLTLRRDVVTSPCGTSVREVIQVPRGVAVVATRDGQLVLVRQYRHAVGAAILEIPAGRLEADESPVATALRELREETGYAGDLVSLGKIYMAPPYSDELVEFFWATNLAWSPLAADDDEVFEVSWIRWDHALDMARNGQIVDAKTIMAILWVESLVQTHGDHACAAGS